MYWSRHFTDLLILMSGGLFTTSIAFAALWVRARERAARAESLLEGMRMMGARNDGVSPALDAIAEEVERIGEGQRFLTRIMSEQASRASLASPRAAGSITPH
jgi:type II secretory pathway component PulM